LGKGKKGKREKGILGLLAGELSENRATGNQGQAMSWNVMHLSNSARFLDVK